MSVIVCLRLMCVCDLCLRLMCVCDCVFKANLCL